MGFGLKKGALAQNLKLRPRYPTGLKAFGKGNIFSVTNWLVYNPCIKLSVERS